MIDNVFKQCYNAKSHNTAKYRNFVLGDRMPEIVNIILAKLVLFVGSIKCFILYLAVKSMHITEE